MPSVGIVGATGYTGLELLRYLSDHPKVEVAYVFSREFSGKKLGDIFPHLTRFSSLVFQEFLPDQLPPMDVCFLALPHGLSQMVMASLLATGMKVVDLSADFRLKSDAQYEAFYGQPHSQPHLMQHAVYGLPELYREAIQTSQLCANPGCYPTASILGLYPLVKKKWVLSTPIIDAKSGVSGAGRSPKKELLLCEASEDCVAYGTGIHRHLPEIEAYLHCSVLFSPHLVPMKRGMLATMYLDIPSDITQSDVESLYTDTYKEDSFVTICSGDPPHTKEVSGTNRCRIGFKKVGHQLVVFSVIDNLGKGASGQAVQNMNLMCGYPETLGLAQVPLWI